MPSPLAISDGDAGAGGVNAVGVEITSLCSVTVATGIAVVVPTVAAGASGVRIVITEPGGKGISVFESTEEMEAGFAASPVCTVSPVFELCENTGDFGNLVVVAQLQHKSKISE